MKAPKIVKPAVHPAGSCTHFKNAHCGHDRVHEGKAVLVCCRCGEVYR